MKMKDNYPTQEYLHTCFMYDSITGDLIWKERPVEHFANTRTWKRWNNMFSGKVAGYINKAKDSDTLHYKTITLDNKIRKAHVLVWIMAYGSRVKLIDHIDMDGTNNRLDNLRELTVSKNARKCKPLKSNKSGYKGVCARTDSSKWYVSLKVNGKTKSLGSYDDIVYASKVYSTAVLILEGEVFSESEPFDINSEDYKNVLNKL